MVFSGKYAVVTGGNGAIGLEICKELLSNGVEKVAILDIQSDDEAKKFLVDQIPETKYKYFKINVASKDEIEQCYKQIMVLFKRIDIVVNVAAIFNDKNFQQTLDVNIAGVMNSTLTAMEYMSKEKNGHGGSIVQIASIGGISPFFVCPIYCATKFAVVGFARCLGSEIYLQNTGIKFFTVCPGATKSPMICNNDSKMLFSYLSDDYKKVVENSIVQDPIEVGKCVVKTITKAENGDVVVIENGISQVVVYEEPKYSRQL